MNFEWAFRAGDILPFIGGLCMAAAFLYRRGGDEAQAAASLMALTKEVAESKKETKDSIGAIQIEIKKIGDVLINQADQNRRLIHLEEDVRDLRHGRGFIQGTTGVDREYP
jgi:hypothetical protein